MCSFMILTIYSILLLFSLIIIGLGFWINNPTLELIGFFFLFVLGLVMMSGGIKYVVGESYVYDNGTLVSSSASFTYFDASTSGEILNTFSLNHLIGILISILGGFGMSITMFNMRVRD
jgi:hypothetical protein